MSEGDPTVRDGEAPRHDDGRLARGASVGRYVVVDVLGEGGMGVVYAAYDPELDRKVAIKLLQARAGGSQSGGQTWLLREAQAMAKLAHPNVVAVHDVGAVAGDRVFVAMELVDGVTLRDWIKDKTWREALPVFRAAGAGLAAAHAAGLIHRDFKPDNVIVGTDGRARVMDFGLARLRGEADVRTDLESKSPLSDRLTATGALLGTPAYMAPEIYAGKPADARADQFAFGVALYEALYRARPYKRDDLVNKTATVPKPPAGAPAWLERIALRAVAIDPDARFPSMDALLAALAADPAPARKRLAVGAAVAVACGGLVAAVAVVRAPPEEPCTDASTRLDGVWDAGRRAALEGAFRKLKRPFVDDAIAGTEKTLDGYATSWVAMRTETCRATRVQGDQSEEVLTVRMQCLDDRLVELRTLATLFSGADEPLVLGAAAAAKKLSPLADCADVSALLAPDALPKDPAKRLEATALAAKLAEARATYHAAKPAQALALLDAMAPDVARLHHLPTEAKHHFLTGQVRWVLQGADKGEPEMLAAAWAAEAGKADDTKLEAWLQLTNLANEANRFDVARERLQHASAALERVGNNWEMKVRVLASEALLDSRQNRYDDAIVVAKKARAVAEPHTDSATYAYALLVEGSILNASGHGAEALADFEKVLAYEQTLGERRIEVATALQSLATAELVTGRAADAAKHLQHVIDIDQAIYGDTNIELARAISALAAAQEGSGDVQTALATDEKALDMAKRTAGEDSDLYAMVLGQLAGTLVELDRNKEAIPYLDRALAIQTRKLGAGHVQSLTIAQTRCDALRADRQLSAAVDACKQTLAAAETSLGKDSPLLFIFLAHDGETLLDAKQPRDASAVLERAIAIGAQDPSDLDFVTMLDARARWDLGDHAHAVELAHKARDGFASLGEPKREQTRDADDWLAHHAKP